MEVVSIIIKTKSELESIIKDLLNRIDQLEKDKKILEEMLQHQQLTRRAYHNEEVIKLMYSMYLNGNSTSEIADYLNANNIPAKRSSTWRKSSVGVILKDIYNLYKYLDEEERIQFHKLMYKNTKNKSNTTQ